MLVEAAVPHIEILLNRKLQDSVTAREHCQTLSGKVLEINIQAVPQRILLAPINDTIEVLVDADLKADVVFSGSVLSFMAATQTKPMELIKAGRLKMKGDAVLAGQFQRLIDLAMPDWQEEIAKMFGDYVGPQVSSIIEGFASWGKMFTQRFGVNASEYVQEESRTAPSRNEFDNFSADVKAMQKDLKAVAKEIKKL